MNRSERRRAAKLGQPVAVQPKLVVNGYVDHVTGKKYTDINDYLNDTEKEIAEQASRVSAEIMWDCENYIAFVNILIMLYATKFAVGDLKTVQKSYQKILNNYNKAAEYVDKVGAREALKAFAEEYGIELEFEDFDINLPFDEEEHYNRLCFRLQENGIRRTENGKNDDIRRSKVNV